MKLRVGANWDIAFLDAVKGTSVDALFGKLPFDIVGGARPGFVLPQIERTDVEAYVKASDSSSNFWNGLTMLALILSLWAFPILSIS